ncbi:MAG TPA: DNA-directed RNA polymerase subunit D, partial [Candidatus Thermoplasmatota archaeon]|nr:DNA-directed RNA polymerase subunit D [Candidatus Thermoplasmatota archaeon]
LNGLRRTLLSQVPKLAIDDVTIYDNTSALFDEMVAHRLGLLPIPTDLNQFVRRSECTTCGGEGCANCTVLYTLSKEGPCMVYSGDLTPAADAKFRVVDAKVPIVKLLEGQRIMLEAGAVLGTGAEHAKWQAVTAVGYTEFPSIAVRGAFPPAALEQVARTAPPGAVAVEGNTIRVLDPVKAVTYLRSIKQMYPDAPIEVTHEPDHWVFTVETDGALSPVVAVRRAVSMLMEKLKWVEAETPKLKLPEQAA